MAERFQEVQEELREKEVLIIEEITQRVTLEGYLRELITEMQTRNELQCSELQASHNRLQVTMEMMEKTLQQQMQGIMELMHQFYRGKSLLREGLTAPSEGMTNSPVSQNNTWEGMCEESGSQWGTSFSRVKFPSFDGMKARGWITKCNWYFKFFSSFPEDQKVLLASMHFQGKADIWFQSFVQGKNIPTWEEFTLAIMEQFDEVVPEILYGEFYKMRQEGSVGEYFEKFNELRAQILTFDRDLEEVHFTRCFISGLKEGIKGLVIAAKPQGFRHAVSLAKEYERTFGAIMDEVSPLAKPYEIIASKFRSKIKSTATEVADCAVSLLLSIICLSIFPYFAFWIIILKFFLPQKYAIRIAVCTGVVLLSVVSVFIGFVMLKSKMKRA